jgi:hypothetical protein
MTNEDKLKANHEYYIKNKEKCQKYYKKYYVKNKSQYYINQRTRLDTLLETRKEYLNLINKIGINSDNECLYLLNNDYSKKGRK